MINNKINHNLKKEKNRQGGAEFNPSVIAHNLPPCPVIINVSLHAPPKGAGGSPAPTLSQKGKIMKTLICLVLGFILTGCGANMQIIKEQAASRVDPISIQDAARFDADLSECAVYAEREVRRARVEMAGKAMLGALIGAGIGYGLGSMYNNSGIANRALAYGGLAGAAGGVAGSANHYNAIIGNCLIHRGYSLLW